MVERSNEAVEKVGLAFRALSAINELKALQVEKSGFFYNLNVELSGAGARSAEASALTPG